MDFFAGHMIYWLNCVLITFHRLRKIAAILLILVLFFNLGGYRIIIPFLQSQADRRLEALLDNNEYDESELVEIRVPMNLPYQQRFTSFERHYGEIEIDGRSYTYVKSRIDGDVVIFKCIANASKQELKAIENNITKTNSAADMDQNGQSKQQPFSMAKKALGDYDGHHDFEISLTAPGRKHFTPNNGHWPLLQPAINTPHQPPEMSA